MNRTRTLACAALAAALTAAAPAEAHDHPLARTHFTARGFLPQA